MTWRTWLRGLIGAAINTAASSITVVIVDPNDFNPFDPNDVGTEECSSCGWEHPDPDMDREVDDAMDEEG